MRKHKYLWGLLCMTIICCTFTNKVVEAEELPDFALEQIVITATKTPVKLAEVGADVSVVTRAEIEKHHYRNVPDALRQVPGVQVNDYGYPGAATSIHINGSNRILVLLDGKRMNMPYDNTLDTVNLVGTDYIERIEVVKGAASALYGSEAAGGVINIITRKGEQKATKLGVGVGNNDRTSYTLTNSGQENKVAWFFSYQDEHYGDFRAGNHTTSQDKAVGEKREYSAYDGRSYIARLDYQVNEKNNLTFGYQGYHNEGEYPGSLTWPSQSWGKDSSQSLSLLWDAQYSDTVNGFFRVYRNNGHYTNANRDGSSPYEKTNHLTGVEYQINGQLGADHLLTGGIEWRREEVEGNSIVDRQKENDSKAIYLQDQWKIGDKVTLISGIRFDDHEQYGNNTSPKIALNYQPSEKTNLYTSWGKFFRAPSFMELYYKSGLNYGNPDLKPETGHSWEIGANHRFSDSVQGSIHYFDRRTEDAIKWSTVDYMTFAGTYENVAKQKARGLDLELTKKISPRISLALGYNWLDVQESTQNPDGSLSEYKRDYNVPRNTWKARLAYQKDKWQADLQGRYIHDRRGKEIGSKFPEATYWVFDASLNYEVSADLSAYLTVRNIMDQYYQEYAGYPSSGRAILLGLNYTF